ncbi:hypothetical protein H8356DRAFT_1352025 [Neocallimastix lanati (nom. inval.)]|nr:hypothetical protein H8356DRAFT_1352025 [Neocallimastix sp. JGI-2020a]
MSIFYNYYKDHTYVEQIYDFQVLVFYIKVLVNEEKIKIRIINKESSLFGRFINSIIINEFCKIYNNNNNNNSYNSINNNNNNNKNYQNNYNTNNNINNINNCSMNNNGLLDSNANKKKNIKSYNIIIQCPNTYNEAMNSKRFERIEPNNKRILDEYLVIKKARVTAKNCQQKGGENFYFHFIHLQHNQIVEFKTIRYQIDNKASVAIAKDENAYGKLSDMLEDPLTKPMKSLIEDIINIKKTQEKRNL